MAMRLLAGHQATCSGFPLQSNPHFIMSLLRSNLMRISRARRLELDTPDVKMFLVLVQRYLCSLHVSCGFLIFKRLGCDLLKIDLSRLFEE